jgi:hypothetical protein
LPPTLQTVYALPSFCTTFLSRIAVCTMLRALLVTRYLPGRSVSGRSPVLSVRAPSRLLSTENPATLPPTPPSKPASTAQFSILNEQVSTGALLFTVVVALMGTAAYYQGELKKLEERVTGTAAVLKSDMAGVIKEVDAKIAGAKETIEKEVDAKMAGSEKAVDAKITGFNLAADLKYKPK